MDFWISKWISGFRSGFLDFGVDFRISEWISGFQSGFLDFKVDFWISEWISGFLDSDWISGFQIGFPPTVYEISLVTDSSSHSASPFRATGLFHYPAHMREGVKKSVLSVCQSVCLSGEKF